MTDRLKGLVVALDRDIRDDDAQAIIDAIFMIKGVLAISPSITSGDDWINRTKIKREIGAKLFKILEEDDEAN